jgi:hypothetical protein
MLERQKGPSEKEPHKKYLLLKDLPPIDCNYGFQYLGNYHEKLQVNLSALERISQMGELPLIIVKNENWNPPTAIEPEMVAPGLTAFKKSAFKRNSERQDTDRQYFRLSVTPQKTDLLSEKNIPIGWVISIKDRKIIHDYQYAHPEATSTEIGKDFIRNLNQIINDALISIALTESFTGRTGEMLSKSMHLLTRFALQFNILSTGIISAAGQNKPELFEPIIALLQLTTHGFLKLGTQGEKVLMKYAQNLRQYGGKTPEQWATYYWRQENFPEKFTDYYKDVNKLKKLISIPIPGNVILENVYRTWIGLTAQKDPIFLIKK